MNDKGMLVDDLVGPLRTGQRVLYIGGWGRSGSTLLDRMLGQVPGLVSVGEVRELWQRGLVDNGSCGCGRPFLECPFWSEVGRSAFGGWSSLDLDEVTWLRYSLDRGWTTPVLLARGRKRLSPDLRKYAEILEALYRGIGEASGGRVIVDSSKLPSHALLARLVRSLDLRMVHLVRDSRGVVFSWSKQVDSGSASGERRDLERYGASSASARYLYYNGLTALAGWMGVPYLRVRYEDLVAGPQKSLARILRHAGVAAGRQDLAFLRAGGALLEPNHTVDGNPMRFAVGGVTLRLDDEWKQHMSPADRRWVTALTSPALWRYGYLTGTRGRKA